eukprot:2169282-Pyramimonas_sp.AAC.1
MNARGQVAHVFALDGAGVLARLDAVHVERLGIERSAVFAVQHVVQALLEGAPNRVRAMAALAAAHHCKGALALGFRDQLLDSIGDAAHGLLHGIHEARLRVGAGDRLRA